VSPRLAALGEWGAHKCHRIHAETVTSETVVDQTVYHYDPLVVIVTVFSLADS